MLSMLVLLKFDDDLIDNFDKLDTNLMIQLYI